jgi:hypothetical protein
LLKAIRDCAFKLDAEGKIVLGVRNGGVTLPRMAKGTRPKFGFTSMSRPRDNLSARVDAKSMRSSTGSVEHMPRRGRYLG